MSDQEVRDLKMRLGLVEHELHKTTIRAEQAEYSLARMTEARAEAWFRISELEDEVNKLVEEAG